MKARKIISVYVSAFLVGVALILFPAAGNIFMDPDYHGFSSSQYGSLFIPQIILAIVSSLSAPKFAEKWGMKKVLLFGLGGILTSMILMWASRWFMPGNLDYWLVLGATACLGMGFGFTITALNPFAFNLFPGKETSAVTALHIMLGLGTATAALLLNTFLHQGIWWAAPLLIAVIILGLILITLLVPLKLPAEEPEHKTPIRKVPRRILWFALAVFLYGACEATFGNFGAIFLEKEGGLTLTKAAVGLSLFWGGITLGRIFVTLMALKFSTKWLYLLAPFVLSLVFYLLPAAKSEVILLACMLMGGLASSLLFPKSISVATGEFPRYAAVVSGMLVAALQLGTGISSYLIGFLNSTYTLSQLFQYSAFYALLLGILISVLMLFKTKIKPVL